MFKDFFSANVAPASREPYNTDDKQMSINSEIINNYILY